MYTFVYRTFIKFILFCQGQALDAFGLELLRYVMQRLLILQSFNALTGLSCYDCNIPWQLCDNVSMPSRAWVVTLLSFLMAFCLKNVSMPSRAWVVTGTACRRTYGNAVSMPSRAWVVTARMSNILNSSWYFLCIPAIYRCILAYLPIFFNQLSKFLRCESPSTFLGTCLSHHSFIIFLVTNTNTLLSGLYLISTGIV